MKERPLAIAICVCTYVSENEDKDKVLLIKREKGDYVGLWGFPGGKIEKNEFISQAAEREILEESGVESIFFDYIGVVTEHLVDKDGNVLQHFLLEVCELEAKTSSIVHGVEGEVRWFTNEQIAEMEADMIPSDFQIWKHMVFSTPVHKRYAECVIKDDGERYILEKFQ